MVRILSTCSILILISSLCFADYGSGAVDIKCSQGSDSLVISTHIKWNQEYDSFMDKYPNGSLISQSNAVFLLSAIDEKNNFKANYSCDLTATSFKVIIFRSGHFSIFNKDNKPIYKYSESYPSKNDIYRLSYYLEVGSNGIVNECITRKGQQQVCGQNILNKVISKPNKSKQKDAQ